MLDFRPSLSPFPWNCGFHLQTQAGFPALWRSSSRSRVFGAKSHSQGSHPPSKAGCAASALVISGGQADLWAVIRAGSCMWRNLRGCIVRYAASTRPWHYQMPARSVHHPPFPPRPLSVVCCIWFCGSLYAASYPSHSHESLVAADLSLFSSLGWPGCRVNHASSSPPFVYSLVSSRLPELL